jgi:hypothetical protein
LPKKLPRKLPYTSQIPRIVCSVRRLHFSKCYSRQWLFWSCLLLNVVASAARRGGVRRWDVPLHLEVFAVCSSYTNNTNNLIHQ